MISAAAASTATPPAMASHSMRPASMAATAALAVVASAGVDARLRLSFLRGGASAAGSGARSGALDFAAAGGLV
jgi:hypothetical protein